MIKSKVIQLMRARLGNRRDSDFESIIELEADIIQETELEGSATLRPWFLQSPTVELQLTATSSFLALPSDFLGEIEGVRFEILISDNTWQEVKKRTESNFDSSQAPALPEYYAIVGDSLQFYPTPDQDYSVRWRYYQKQPKFGDITSTEETSWTTAGLDLFVASVGRVFAAQHAQNMELANTFEIQRQEALNRLYVETEARMHTNTDYRMRG